jgi:trehalose 6-phosphate phosphatase
VVVPLTVAETLRPLTEAPEQAAIFLDIDGTLAPIVERASDARVPAATRGKLRDIAARYRLVACVSGRAAEDARRLVGLDELTYAGAHGAELLEPDAEVTVLPAFAEWTDRVHEFAASHDVGARMEDKGPIVAYHWRGVSGVDGLQEVAEEAERQGFLTHWGRKVLEIRPGVPVNKGQAVAELIRRTGATRSLFAGDDVTDLDAFAIVDVTVGVASDEGPPEIGAADIVVDGPEGFLEVLDALR